MVSSGEENEESWLLVQLPGLKPPPVPQPPLLEVRRVLVQRVKGNVLISPWVDWEACGVVFGMLPMVPSKATVVGKS